MYPFLSIKSNYTLISEAKNYTSLFSMLSRDICLDVAIQQHATIKLIDFLLLT